MSRIATSKRVTITAAVIFGVLIGIVISAQIDIASRISALHLFGEGGEGKATVEKAAPTAAAAQESTAASPTRVVSLPDFTELAERSSPFVVNISTTQVIKGRDMWRSFRFGPQRPGERFGPPGEPDPFEDFFDKFFAPHGDIKRQSLGSGFIISADGYVLTNYHVVKDAESITVILYDESEHEGTIVGRDAKTDIALVKIDSAKNFPVAPMGNSDALKVGDWVLAIGNPFGLKYTVTAGIVSAKGRDIGAGPYDDFIQTDASINPGNSGGPLINMKGEVVGINTAIVAGGAGIGFAIPINMAQQEIPQLKEKGRVNRGWLGVLIQRVTPELAKSFGLDHPEGALVAEISKGGPAEGSGLKAGDVIIEFQGEKIHKFNDLPRLVASTPPGTEVQVKVLREGKTKTFKITLGELPAEETPSESAGGGGGELGLQLQEVTPELARAYGLSSTKGLVVTDVDPDGLAAEGGIRRGDIIVEVNQKAVTTLQEFQKAVAATKKGQMILFLVKRNEGSLFIAIEKKEK